VTEQRRAWLIVGLLFLFMMLNFSDKAIVGLAGVPMMKELGLTPRQFGLVGSSFFFLFSISAVIGGFVANRVQTRWLLLAMAVIWAATQLPMVGSIGLATVVACRVTLGPLKDRPTRSPCIRCTNGFPIDCGCSRLPWSRKARESAWR
jgi:MFS transporter, ACS family, D-galactonate transporter